MTDDEFALALRMAAKYHGIKLGVLDENGNLTEAAIQAAADVARKDGAKPGDGYVDQNTSNFYTMDLNANWVFGFNALDLRRKMRNKPLEKTADLFLPGRVYGDARR